MPYTPSTWADGPSGNTAITAAKMTNLETQHPQAVADAKTYTDRLAVSVASSMTQAQIQTVLSGVVPGTRVFFMPGTYNLAGPLTVAVDNTFIDARTATFVQTTWGYPGFDAIGRNGCTYDIGLVQWSGTRGGVGSTYRGSAQYCSGAGVWINGDNNFVRYLKTSYMPVGVFLSSYAGSTAYDHVGVGNRIGVMESDHANWGVLYVGQQNLVIDDLYVHDDLDDSSGANPTHAIYGSATTSFRATGGAFKSVRASNMLTGQPVQVKFHDSLRVGAIAATGCVGLLNVMDSNDFTLDTYTSLGTLANGGQGAITFQRSVTNSQRPHLGRGYIQMAANVDERVVSIISDNGTYDTIEIDSNHSGSVNPATTGEILVRGTGNRLRRPTIRSLGAGSIPGIWVGFSEAANNTVIENPTVNGTLNLGKIDSASTGAVLDYDTVQQSITGTTIVDTTGGTSYSTTTGPAGTLNTLGDDSGWAFIVNTGTVTVGSANSALQVRVTPRRKIAVSSLVWWSSTASGNYDIAIVDDATNTVLWTRAAGSSSVAWPAAGKITETVTGVTMLPGRTYRVAFAADNTTGALRGITNGAGAGLDLRLDGSTKTTTVSSSFPISTSTLAGGTSGTTQRIAFMVLQGS